MKDKKAITITNSFQKIWNESKRKPNKMWVDKGSEYCDRLMKSSLEKNDMEMYSAHNKGEFVIVERFIRSFRD